MKVISEIRKALQKKWREKVTKKKKRRKSFYLEIRIRSTTIRHVASRLFPRNLKGKLRNTWKKAERCIFGKTLGRTSRATLETWSSLPKHNDLPMGVIIRFTIFSVLLFNTIMLNLGISLMVQYLGFCLPMRGHWFDPWSGKIPHATGQLNPCYTTPEASTLEPTLSNKRSHHTEKPKHCSCKEPAQPKRKKKKNSKKKVTLNLGNFLKDMWHIYHERKNQGNI